MFTTFRPAFVIAATGALLVTASPAAMANDHIATMSGGIGLEQRQEAEQKARAEGYTTKLAFSTPSGSYLSDVNVTIKQGSETVYEGVTEGPFLFLKLPKGSYTAHASVGGQQEQQSFSAGSGGLKKVMIRLAVEE